MQNLITKAKEQIEKADALLITAGAGMGVDSGLPDFRGDEGFWKAYPAAERLGLSFVELANPEWFVRDSTLAWAFYGHRLSLYRETIPNDGFRVLLDLAETKEDYFVFTSNVDGQFQKADFSDNSIYECHGSIHHLQCTVCDHPVWSAKDIQVPVDMEEFVAQNIPLCPSCGAVARPNILMFGDWGWDSSRSDAQSYRFQTFITWAYQAKKRLAIIEIGAGSHVPTVRYTSETVARDTAGYVVRINPREPEISSEIGVGLAIGGLEGLHALLGDE